MFINIIEQLIKCHRIYSCTISFSLSTNGGLQQVHNGLLHVAIFTCSLFHKVPQQFLLAQLQHHWSHSITAIALAITTDADDIANVNDNHTLE